MGEVFTGQDIRIRRRVMRLLAGITNPRLNYEMPDGTIGFWVGVVDGKDIYYDYPASANTIPGWWKFWVSYEKGGKKYTGTRTKQYISA